MNTIQVVATDAEIAEWKEAAKSQGLSLSEFVRLVMARYMGSLVNGGR